MLNGICDSIARLVRQRPVNTSRLRPCRQGHRPEEVRMVNREWFGTDEKVGWIRCRDCGAVLVSAKVVGDGPIVKEPWE